MRHRWVLWPFVFAVCAIGSARAHVEARQSPSGEQFAGTWSGTWDGAGSGDFVLTLEKGTAGAVTGKVDVVTDAGNYTAELKSLTFEGQKMSARYDFPLDSGSEIVVTATFDVSTAKGSWSLRPKGQSAESAGGTWTVTRK
jgi:hypothetical protein